MAAGISDKNRKILDELNRTQKGPFTAKDVTKLLSMPLKKTSILLTYFTTKGWLSRIRRGLYITVPLGTINPKEYKENPWIVASRIFAPCYIGGWNAAEYWEFTDQIFNSVVIFTTRRQRNKNMQIQGTEFIIKFVKERYFGKTKSIWIDNSKVLISDPIQTIVDILDDPSIGGGIRNIADIVQEYFISQYRNDDEIIKYINQKKNRTIYKRLGFLIETCDIDATKLSKVCQQNISKGFSLLDSSIEKRGSCNMKWKLQVNVRINK